MLAICLALIDDEEDKVAFENLYYKYRGKAYAIVYDILKNSALAEDACSEAFFSIAKVYTRIQHLELLTVYRLSKACSCRTAWCV